MRHLRLIVALSILAFPAFAQDAPPSAGPAAPAPVGAAVDPGQPLAPSPVGPAPSDLAAALAGLQEDPIFRTAAVSVEVVNARTGAKVYGWGDDKALIPASTMKILTGAVALKTLGPNWRFPTWILHDGELGADGVLAGNLYVKGQGDPTMVVERMWRMVLDLKLKGVREIKGDVVFDDSYFADTTLIPGWTKEEDIQDGPTYFAPLGALSVNYNIAAIVVRPGAGAGQPAVADLETPTPVLAIENRLTTGGKNSRRWVKIERTVDAETGKITTFKLTGNIPAESAPDTFYRTLADPLGNYIGTFEMMAKQHGIKVKGKLRPGATAPDAKLVLRADSEPLSEIVALTSKHSNNFMAEQVLRAMGAETYGLPGTTAKGVQVVDTYLQSLGIPKDEYRLVNGSGLSREVLLRPAHIDRVLVDMWSSVELAPEFATSLSVGGRDGTLYSRFREDGMAGRVRGKTGTLAGVHCLAGYIRAADGETYAFTFLVNDIDGALSRARRAHDRLVVTVAGVNGNIADGGDLEAAGQ